MAKKIKVTYPNGAEKIFPSVGDAEKEIGVKHNRFNVASKRAGREEFIQKLTFKLKVLEG